MTRAYELLPTFLLLVLTQRDLRVLLAALLSGRAQLLWDCTLSSDLRQHAKDPLNVTTVLVGPGWSLQPQGGIKWKTLGIGEVVDANRMASTEYKLNFRTDRKNQEICSRTLTAGDLGKFRQVGTQTVRVLYNVGS